MRFHASKNANHDSPDQYHVFADGIGDGGDLAEGEAMAIRRRGSFRRLSDAEGFAERLNRAVRQGDDHRLVLPPLKRQI